MTSLPKIEVTSRQFLLGTACLYLIVFNFPFMAHSYRAAFETANTSVTFLIALPMLLLAILYLTFSLTLWGRAAKPMLGLVSLASLAVLYGELSFGVVFDNDMVRNVFETDFSEARSYLSLSSVSFLAVGSAIIIAALAVFDIQFLPLSQEIRSRVTSNALLAVIAVLLTYSCYGEFAATARNNNVLKRELVPFEWFDSTLDYWAARLWNTNHHFTLIDSEPHLADSGSVKAHATIVIVGETARADHFEYDGYPRNTNQHTKPYEVVYIQDVHSCGTSTAISVPCMFSDQTQEQFVPSEAKHRQNALDIASLATVEVIWIDNNSGCKGVCDRVNHERFNPKTAGPLCDGNYCLDEILVARLKEELPSQPNAEKIIVLHEIGSHGPTYFRRYPEKQKVFAPDCRRSDIQNCSQEELVNAYDNTIVYTDWVNAGVLQVLDEAKATTDATVLYVSDHGESLGENGLYLHGMPYFLAPESQTHVPMWIWQTGANGWRECIRQNSDHMVMSHDIVFHTILDAAHVESGALKPKQSLLTGCVTHSSS